MAGIVHAMGEKTLASGSCAVGERVTVFPWIGCGDCSVCNSGEDRLCQVNCRELGMVCDGGYSEFVVVPHPRYLVKLPEGVPFAVGALLPCSTLTAYSSIGKCSETVERMRRRGGGVCVGVVGLGGVGQWAVRLIPHCLGSDVRIVGIDISSEKLQAAKDGGFVSDVFALSRDETVKQQIDSYTKNLLERPHAILDFVNSSQTFSLCVQLLVRTGVHVMVGLYGGLGELKLPLATLSGASHVANYIGDLQQLEEVVELVDREKIEYSQIKAYRLEEVEQALLDLEAGLVEGRAVLDMQ